MEDNKNLRYLVMPDFVYSDNKLTDVSRRVYCFIHTFKGEYFFFGNEHLAKMFNCSEWSISQAMSQLVELEYIFCEYRQKSGGGKTRFVKDLKFEFINGWTPLGEKPNLKIGFSNSGDKKSEATTLGKPNDNDIKDNNIKEKILEDGDLDPLEERRIAREYRNSRKGRGLGGYSAPQSNYPKFEKKVKAGTHAEDIR